jgi:hypothetical protein
MRTIALFIVAGFAFSVGAASALQERTDVFVAPREHPAIVYSTIALFIGWIGEASREPACNSVR